MYRNYANEQEVRIKNVFRPNEEQTEKKETVRQLKLNWEMKWKHTFMFNVLSTFLHG